MKLIQTLIALLVRKVFGIAQVTEIPNTSGPQVYYANHTSHLDFLLLWSAVPDSIRPQLRPVAAKDYWGKTMLRRFIADNIFRAILIERHKVTRHSDPLSPMLDALDEGDSLIIFPEGTRCAEDASGELKSGIYHLHRKRPEVPLIPVWLGNSGRAFPKGAIVPIPVIAKVSIGESIPLKNQSLRKPDFLSLAKTQLLSLQAA